MLCEEGDPADGQEAGPWVLSLNIREVTGVDNKDKIGGNPVGRNGDWEPPEHKVPQHSINAGHSTNPNNAKGSSLEPSEGLVSVCFEKSIPDHRSVGNGVRILHL